MPSVLPLSPSTVSADCLCLGLKRAARAVSRRYDEAMRPLDLTSGQFSMLTAIAGMQPAGMRTLAEHLAMDRTTLTAALKPLERQALVEVLVSESDARVRDISLTDSGQALLAQAMAVWQSLQKELAAELGNTGVAALRGQLSRIV